MTEALDSVAQVVSASVARYRGNPHYILQMLREIQEACGWISPEAIDCLQRELRLPRTKIEGVAGFYAFLYSSPPGRYRVLFSDNITDRMMGNMELLDYMCEQLWVERGKTSEDGLVSIDTASCTGMCDQGPALLVNSFAITRMTRGRVDEICELIRSKVPLADWPSDYFRVEDQIVRKDILLGSELGPGGALAAGLARGPEALLTEIKQSNLRGRGGAGFGAGLKWEACRNAPGNARYVVCNADEGEPGTFKDRVLLTSYADMVFEGMTLCALAVGAKRGMLYLRGEYRYLLERLHAVLESRRQSKLLGESILGRPGFDFDIEIHLGAGAYICGEESALIESLEGKRGTPRNRPPFPVTHGYLDQPTVVNNVETFAASCLIAERGGSWYAAIGTGASAGTKILSVPAIAPGPVCTSIRSV